MREPDPKLIHTHFAPMLVLKDGVMAIEFYKQAFKATELRRWNNPDGSPHVAELAIDEAIFHIREQSQEKGQFCPSSLGGVTSIIELFVEDPQALAAQAVAAGAHMLSPVVDHEETGYCQGTLVDPFGHRWSLLRRIKRG